MYSFKNDYSEGAHPNILKKLIETNFEQAEGYGDDDYSIEAKESLKLLMKNGSAKIYFVSGGTQTNMLVIGAILRPHEAAISASTGHIFTHEAGAIEAVGHRIIDIETKDGKLRPADILKVLDEFSMRPHMVKPKLVYISNSTEIGTVYNKEELSQLYSFCKTNDLILFLDGARLGNALTAEGNDLNLADVSNLTDVFYIGGTKNGALIGEAIVFNKLGLDDDFDYIVKQKGALLAKGRVIGIQFLELFKDNLYFDLAKRANELAMRLSKAIENAGFEFLIESKSNQIFPIFPNVVIEKLAEKYSFHIWHKIDDEKSAIRLITSWATEESKIDEFIDDLANVSQK